MDDVDVLTALLRETYTTKTYEDILLAAYDSSDIADSTVNEARQSVTEIYNDG